MTPHTPPDSWHHVLDPAPGVSAPTALLLHGTGGDERQLLPLAAVALPGLRRLGVRGRSLDEGYPRYFRRFGPTTYDGEQIVSEAASLARFLSELDARAGTGQPLAVGYSNGANMALALLALHPAALRGAALLRPVLPLSPMPQADLGGLPVLVLHGQGDPYAAHAGGVVPYLREHGAQVTEATLPGGHALGQGDAAALRAWWAGQPG